MQHPCNRTTTHRNRWRDTSHIHTSQPNSSWPFTLPNQLRYKLISPADSGSDVRHWMTRGNHIEPRYDHIEERLLMPCTKTQLDHALPYKKGSLLIPSLMQLTFPLKDNITQLPASCFWQKQYMDVWQSVSALCLDNSGIITLWWAPLKVTSVSCCTAVNLGS